MRRARTTDAAHLGRPSCKGCSRLAESAARAGGEVARRAFGRYLKVRIKHDHSEVTQVDEAAQAAVLTHLHGHRPHDRFVGEESDGAAEYGFGELAVAAALGRRSRSRAGAKGSAKPAAPDPKSKLQNPESQVTWVVDPIDGHVRNFIRGVPMFTCAVAAMVGGHALVVARSSTQSAASYSPPRWAARPARRFAPASDCWPAFLSCSANHEPAAATRSLKPVIAIPSAWRNDSGPFVRRLLETSVVRSLGSGTLHLVYVLLGGFDATYMNNCKLWDIAAVC